MAPVTKKEISFLIKKANQAYNLDLAIRYEENKPTVYRQGDPKRKLSPENLTMGKLFYWLDAWIEGYGEGRTSAKKPRPLWKDEDLPWLEK
jgi:hypothetical protein